jgi:hypothetical protein
MAGFLVNNNSMIQDGKFFSSDIIGLKGLESFIAVNESLSMSFFVFDKQSLLLLLQI